MTEDQSGNTNSGDRRPIQARSWKIMNKLAAKLAAWDVSPNSISGMSMIMAVFGALSFIFAMIAGEAIIFFLILGVIFNILRLVCNLLDGMVAVEHNKSSVDGAFWNEVPDRISDFVTFAAVGIAAGSPSLGLLTACLAIFVAYLRAFGSSLGFPADFRGPAAKQTRIQIICGAATLTMFEGAIFPHGTIFKIALIVLIALILVTAFRRINTILDELEDRG